MKTRFLLLFLVVIAPLSFAGSAGAPDVWPNWALSVTGDVPTKAYPDIPYESRIGVVGGQYPYTFSLATSPSGMSIEESTGIITWTPGSVGSNQVSVRVTDSASDTTTYNFTLEVTTSGIHFISPQGSDSSGAGTLASPWQTMQHARSNAGSDAVIYMRAGTYNTGSLSFSSSSPNIWIAYPNESVKVNVTDIEIYYSDASNKLGWFQGIEFYGCTKYCFKIERGINLVFYKNHMRDMNSSCDNCNPSYIYFAGHQSSDARHSDVKVINNRFVNFTDTGGSETDGATVAFDVHNSLFADNEIINLDGYGMVDKDNTFKNTYRNNYITNSDKAIGLKGQQGLDSIHIHHNLMVDNNSIPICEYGPCSNVYFHHNTVVNSYINLRGGIDNSNSGNINFAYNILTSFDGSKSLFRTDPKVFDGVLAGSKVFSNYNVIHTNTSRVAGESWGGAYYVNEPEWTNLHDRTSHFIDPNLSGSGKNIGLSESSQFYGIYGHQLGDGESSLVDVKPNPPSNLLVNVN